MSKHDTDENAKSESLEDRLWDGGDDAVDELHAAAEPGFDNSEGRLAVDESMVDDAQFAVPGDESPDAAPKKKRSNVAFYAVVGTFAVAAAGLIGYKAGLFGGGSKRPLEPITLAQAPAQAGASVKNESMLIGGSGDLLSGSAAGASAKPAATVSAIESDLFGESAARATTAAPPALEAQTSPAAKAEPVVEVAKIAQAPVEKPAVVEKPVEVVKDPVRKDESLAAAAKPGEVRKPRTARSTTAVVVKNTAAKPRLVVASKAKRHPVVVASAKKGKADRAAKDPRPDTPEVMAGWSLRGTWPSQGPSQRAWIADEQGRITTVSVGQYVSGAKVISIGKRGEMVLTTAGQIVP